MASRALSFGTAAAAYERYRPGYSDSLVDEVFAYAGGPLDTALEIGAGTGKATRVFAARGVAVTATEPDPAMLTQLIRHVPANVSTLRAAFEQLPLEPVYGLVFAAASLHWTVAEHRWHRVAGMLRDGGVFASFGGPVQLADPETADAVALARADVLATDDIPSPDGTAPDDPVRWPGTELIRSGLFVDVRQVTMGRRLTVSADGYVGHLSTVSAYLELPDAVRAEVFGRIRQVLPPQVTLVADLTAHLARKK